MKTRTLKQLLLYNYRFYFAYAVIAGFIAYFLGWRLANIGPGLAQQEIANAARHIHIIDIVHQPLYILQSLLQWGSMHIFGITVWSLRLPSVIIAAMTAVCLYNLLKRWFGKSTALLSTAIFISADWFLYVARLGTGAIEFSFWLTLALLCFTKLLEHKFKWLPILAIALGGLLFAPLGIYAVITLLASLFGCRVFRERFFEAKLWLKVSSALLLLLAMCLFAYAIFLDVLFLKNILGIQAMPSITGYFSNLFYNMSNVVAIFPDSNPSISPTGIFIVRYFEFIFILFGVIMLWRTRVNRLNLTVLILTVVLVLASGLSSGARGTGVILIPAAIYMTAGIRHLMHRWKRTFPKNPYARVGAYIPLGVLFVLVVSAHYISYFVLWPSQTDTHIAFTRDFMLVKNELNHVKYRNKSCLVQTGDIELRKLIVASETICKPEFPDQIESTTKFQALILQPSITNAQFIGANQTSRALTSEATNNSTRWVVVSTLKP